MKLVQKVLVSLLIATIIFTTFAVAGYSGLFQLIDQRFYNERVRESTAMILDEARRETGEYQKKLLRSVSSFAEVPAVENVFFTNQSRQDTEEQQRAVGVLFQNYPELSYLRIVDSNGGNLWFSTLKEDVLRSSDFRVEYKPVSELSPPLALPPPSEDGSGIRWISDRSGIQATAPIIDSFGIPQGLVVTWANLNGLFTELVSAEILGPSSRLRLTEGGTLVYNAPREFKDPELALLDEYISGQQSGFLESDTGVRYALEHVPAGDGLPSAVFLINEADLTMDEPLRRILFVVVFFIAFLVTYLILNIRQDPEVVIAERFRRFQQTIVKDYLREGRAISPEVWQRELDNRKAEIEEKMQRGLGKLKTEKRTKLEEHLQRNWDELYRLMGERPSSRTELEPVSLQQIEAIIERTLARYGRHGLAGTADSVPGSGGRPGVHKPQGSPAPDEGVDSSDQPSSADNYAEVEELDEIADLEPADEEGAASSSQAIGSGEPVDVEEVDEIEEIEALEEAEEIAEADEVDELDEIDELEEIEEAAEAEEAAELDEIDELEEIAELEEIEEVPEAEEVDELDEIDELEEIEEAAEEEEAAELEEIDELEEIAELDEVGSLVDGTGPDEAEEVSDLEEVAEAAEADEVDELEEIDEVPEAEEAAEPDEIDELEEAEDLAGADELDELEEIEEVPEAEEVNELEEIEEVPEAEEAAELDEIDELEEIAELDEVGSLVDGTGPDEAEEVSDLEEVEEAAEAAEADEVDELEEIEEVPEAEEVDELDEIDELEEAEDLAGADEVDELEEIEEVPEAEEAAELDEIDELDELDDLVERAEPEEAKKADTYMDGDGMGDEIAEIGFPYTEVADAVDELEAVEEDDQGSLDAEPIELPPTPSLFLSSSMSFGGGFTAGLTGSEGDEDSSDSDNEAADLQERVKSESIIIRGLENNISYQVVELDDFVDFAGKKRTVIDERNGLAQIEASAYFGDSPGANAPIQSLAEQIIHHRTFGSIDDIMGAAFDESDFEDFLEHEPFAHHRSFHGTTELPLRVASGGFELPYIDASEDAGVRQVYRELVGLTRRWDARSAVILEQRKNGVVGGSFSLGLPPQCTEPFEIPLNSDLVQNVITFRRVALLKTRLSSFRGFENSCHARGLNALSSWLFLPLSAASGAYLMVGFARSFEDLLDLTSKNEIISST